MLTTLLPRFHLLLYSALLGTSLFQTFVLTKVSFQALPRSAFITLQKRLFPVYFRVQTLLLVLTAVTLPLPRVLMADGVLFAVAGVSAVGNLVVYEPRTRGAVDGRGREKGDDTAQHGLEIKRLKKEFSWNHAMTIHLNLVSVGAMVVYGWRLGGKLSR
ncbi:hypothetical protein B0T18DRAFT_361753 [Schizothecium vesticola]|uniref:TMEM205-like domain-containing protein n=1 Tax=Schizothecium vesticola TaxID=314040 RepID=A0AA40F4Z2_9PEZI|nr:hypothetical protein B0T18DRAFT_361753 [Schizothecium vesticola]